MAKKSEKIQYNGTGRRKESIARVRLFPGKGVITVNGKTLDELENIEKDDYKVLTKFMK